MIGLLQRVTSASVQVAGEIVGRIDTGLMVLVGVERGDTPVQAERLLQRLLNYRVFEDAQGRMNLGLASIGGGLLLVPQFTLPADTRKGLRPGFSRAAPPELGKAMFDLLLQSAIAQHPHVQSGVFGADMQVALVNDGPVTFWMQVPPPAGASPSA